LVLLVLLHACDSSPAIQPGLPTRSPPTAEPPDARAIVPADAPTVNDAKKPVTIDHLPDDCIAKLADAQACAAAGRKYRYGNDDVGWCKGTAPPPDEERKVDPRALPCTCFDVAQHEARRETCSKLK